MGFEWIHLAVLIVAQLGAVAGAGVKLYSAIQKDLEKLRESQSRNHVQLIERVVTVEANQSAMSREIGHLKADILRGRRRRG